MLLIMPEILKIYSTKHAAPKQAIKHSSTEGQLPKSNHNNMKKIAEINAKKCYNARIFTWLLWQKSTSMLWL